MPIFPFVLNVFKILIMRFDIINMSQAVGSSRNLIDFCAKDQ